MPTPSRNYKLVNEPHRVLNAYNRFDNGSTGSIGMSNNGKPNESGLSKLDEDSENGGLSTDYSPQALDQRSALGM